MTSEPQPGTGVSQVSLCRLGSQLSKPTPATSAFPCSSTGPGSPPPRSHSTRAALSLVSPPPDSFVPPFRWAYPPIQTGAPCPGSTFPQAAMSSPPPIPRNRPSTSAAQPSYPPPGPPASSFWSASLLHTETFLKHNTTQHPPPKPSSSL